MGVTVEVRARGWDLVLAPHSLDEMAEVRFKGMTCLG